MQQQKYTGEIQPSPDRSAFVALTEEQIYWLALSLKELRETVSKHHFKKWNGKDMPGIEDIEKRLKLAAYALREGKQDE